MTPSEALRRTLEVHASVDVSAVVKVFGVREAEVVAELLRLGFVEDGEYWRKTDEPLYQSPRSTREDARALRGV